ncbi:MAG TPA: MoaD/ThiS family protein [Kiritimatiellia bacterium]|nr:MoaD/ThiS family protein [Kiritimatiellia bacterium]
MRIHLEYVAMLKVDGPPSGCDMEVATGTTTGDLLHQLAIPVHHQKSVSVFVNDKWVTRSSILEENDRVFLSVPMSGG